MSHCRANGDNGLSAGHLSIMLGSHSAPEYRMPSKPCAICGHVVRHPEPEALRAAAREHFAEAHAEVTA